MFGENLKRVRQKRKFTQKKLAEELGVSRQAICLWESNKRELKASVLKDIAKVLGVKADELMKGDSSKEEKAIDFIWPCPNASEVAVIGDFTGWNRKIPLKRFKDGVWRRKVTLPGPGRYEYKFFVDGEWQIDPHNKATVFNPHGTLNSVKELV
ncbi:MAG TPA: helix-turn-helix domain-containing protein [Candidatus Omnitrophota bacterium]|nr:helix-turn-helix domain-containing protein [Candidatus Omnitrophota bacterium]